MSTVSIFRKAMQDTVLADGTHIPKGTLIAAAAYGAHHDDDNYANAMDFDAFRFARLRATAPEGSDSKFQFVNTANDFLGFGHGKGAWYVSVSYARGFANRKVVLEGFLRHSN